jgi:methionyl-tRNA synthetase
MRSISLDLWDSSFGVRFCYDRYLCKEAPYGGELAFSEDSMRDMHNADLCDTLGNLVHRATNLCAKYCGGVVPDVPLPDRPPTDFAGLVESYRDKMDRFELQGGASVAMQGLREVNGYLQDSAPWAMKGDDPAVVQAQQVVVRAALESIYALGHLLLPFIPVGASKIFKKLGTEPTQLASLDPSCRNLKVGTKIEVGDVLYSKSLSDTEVQDAKIAAQKKKKSLAEAQARKKEAKAKNAAKASVGQQQGGGTDKEQPDFTKMDIRVGRIVKVWNHPDADKLFCEEIDVGEDSGPRSIASGLRNYYSLEEMHNRMVLVVCNLKSSKMVGFESQGMVLAAKNEDGSKVELVAPPAGSVVGERVVVQGLAGEPYSSTQVKKKKVWEAVAKDLVTADGGIATWQGASLETSAGPCYVPTLIGAPIS